MSPAAVTIIHLAPGESDKTGIASYADLVDKMFKQYLPQEISVVRVNAQEFLEAFRGYDQKNVLILAQIGSNEGPIYRALQAQNKIRPDLKRIIEVHDPPYLVLSYIQLLDTISTSIFGRLIRRAYNHFLGGWHNSRFINDQDIYICKTEVGTNIFQNLLQKMGKSNSCVHVPIPTYINPFIDRCTGDSDRIRIGFMGHIAASKGIHVLVDAAIEATEQYGRECLPVIEIRGRAINFPAQKYLNNLKKKITDHGLSDRILIGDFIPTDQVVSFFNGISILALPYLTKGRASASGPLLWARSCGIPVVAHDTLSFRELIKNGIDGILIEDCGVYGWLRFFKQLTEDPTLLPTLTKGVKLRQTESAWNSVTKQYLEVMHMQSPEIRGLKVCINAD